MQLGCYLVHSGCHLGDFQKISTSISPSSATNIRHGETPIDHKGELIMDGVKTGLNITNLQHVGKQLEKKLTEKGHRMLDFHHVFED